MPHAGLDVRSLLVYSRVRLVRGSRAGRAVFRGEIVVPAGHGCAFGPGADDCLCRVLRFLPIPVFATPRTAFDPKRVSPTSPWFRPSSSSGVGSSQPARFDRELLQLLSDQRPTLSFSPRKSRSFLGLSLSDVVGLARGGNLHVVI